MAVSKEKLDEPFTSLVHQQTSQNSEKIQIYESDLVQGGKGP